MNIKGIFLAAAIGFSVITSHALTVTSDILTAGEDVNLYFNQRQEGAGYVLLVELFRFERGSIASMWVDGVQIVSEQFDPRLYFYAEVDLANQNSFFASIFTPGDHVLTAFLNNPDTAFRYEFTIESFDSTLPTTIPRENVPDAGSSAAMLLIGVGALHLLRRSDRSDSCGSSASH